MVVEAGWEYAVIYSIEKCSGVDVGRPVLSGILCARATWRLCFAGGMNQGQKKHIDIIDLGLRPVGGWWVPTLPVIHKS